MTAPKYDPAELEAAELTEEAADALREAMDEADRGETVPLAQVADELREELEALAAIEARRAAATRAG